MEVWVELRGETDPRKCEWPGGFRALADLDAVAGGLENFNPFLLHHAAALLWISCAWEMSFPDFEDLIPDNKETILRVLRGASMIWESIGY